MTHRLLRGIVPFGVGVLRWTKSVPRRQKVLGVKSPAPYGYLFGNDSKRTYVVNEEVSGIVKRIFELRAKGISPGQIAEIFNAEKILTPRDYLVKQKASICRLKVIIFGHNFACVRFCKILLISVISHCNAELRFRIKIIKRFCAPKKTG